MDVLLRQVRTGPDGRPEYVDTEKRAESISVGSAAESDIQLLGRAVAAEHAILKGAGGGRAALACRAGCRVTIGGKEESSATLAAGDEVRIGGHALKIVPAPPGFDLAIEVRADTSIGAEEYASAFRTSIDSPAIGKRSLAWMLLLFVLAIGVAIPLYYATSTRTSLGAPHWLPTDELWTTGPLVPAHRQATGNNCRDCHAVPFVRARDKDCRVCHDVLPDHLTVAQREGTKLPPDARCATCHREHGESGNDIIPSDDSLCTNCHARAQELFADRSSPDVSGFRLPPVHPGFRAALLKPVDATATSWKLSVEALDSAVEQSNLKFSHAQHLDPERVQRQDDQGGTLRCADCHTANNDGEHFAPVSMERVCSACHELTFDPNAPDRQLPHGKPRDAVLLIQDYYTREAVNPTARAPVREIRRLPDKAPEAAECTGPPLVCAAQKARTEIENQFTRRGCVSCHVVTDTRRAELLDRFEVQAVRLTTDYFPPSRFSHRAHLVMDDLTGDRACLSCHAAGKSTQSAELLIPDIARCVDCHGDLSTNATVPLACGDCHAYHADTSDKTQAGPPRAPPTATRSDLGMVDLGMGAIARRLLGDGGMPHALP